MNSRPKLNADTDALCTIAHDCGYQVGRAYPHYVRNRNGSIAPTFVIHRQRYLYPLGRRADPERMAAVLALMGVTLEPHHGVIYGRRVFRFNIP